MKSIEKPILEIADDLRSVVPTPYYLIDEARLLRNLEKIQRVQGIVRG
jgi:D-serine deaminase-like pyridoxal phosphate-dependent protein